MIDYTLEEVYQIRSMNGKNGDYFGFEFEGSSECSCWDGMEAYYEMYLENLGLDDELNNIYDWSFIISDGDTKQPKVRINDYKRKFITQRKLEKLSKYTTLLVGLGEEGYRVRYYTTRIGKFAKRESNRAVRHYKGEISKGCNYKKIGEVLYEIW